MSLTAVVSDGAVLTLVNSCARKKDKVKRKDMLAVGKLVLLAVIVGAALSGAPGPTNVLKMLSDLQRLIGT